MKQSKVNLHFSFIDWLKINLKEMGEREGKRVTIEKASKFYFSYKI